MGPGLIVSSVEENWAVKQKPKVVDLWIRLRKNGLCRAYAPPQFGGQRYPPVRWIISGTLEQFWPDTVPIASSDWYPSPK